MTIPQEKQQPSLLIIDSFALLFRGFFSMAMTGNYMRTSYGLCTNGIYQFTKYMLHAVETFQPTHVVCAFDMGSQTFRNEMYDLYKANRDAPPEELVPQFDKLRDLVEAFDIPCVGVKGYEADDVIGTLAARFSKQGVPVNILTGDGDTLQLIDEHVQVTLMKKGFGNYETIHLGNLEEIRGLKHPFQVVEMKALMGDTADNIPGCPNVGPKTALKLIDAYETVDGVYAHLDEIKGKLKERLTQHKEQIYLSRQLATIVRDVPVDCELEECRYEINKPKLLRTLEEFEFKSLIRTIEKQVI
ncbi:5'-3' exonuclease [Marinicrinis lubricantis]|uniref:5'-3' exonuclease n=1 Tax=Marinicrinis lubricantis TaxID=2086470 RepID=A0ABW1ILJ0_9BACL